MSMPRVGSLRIENSSNFSGNVIFWNENVWQSWFMIGCDGLAFHHYEDKDKFVSVRHSQHLYKIIGVDICEH